MKIMKRIVAITAVLVLVVAFAAMAEEKMDKNATCALLGTCSGEMIETAKAMRVECDKMMKKAEELMEKGKMIRGQGMLWQDKEMEADGMAGPDQDRRAGQAWHGEVLGEMEPNGRVPDRSGH